MLWMGSWETNRLYAIDPQSWSVRAEFEAPGKPFGVAAAGSELRAVISHGEDDDRYLYRVSAESGFDLASKAPCPDLTGSFMAVAGSTTYLGQMTFGRILALDSNNEIEREITLPTRCAGFGFGPTGRFYMISGDDELEHLHFGALDVTQNAPKFESIAPVPDEARSLAFDGSRWWTCLRDANEIASFSV
jgi:outer membrane protein assembly factor BamB